MVKTIHSGRHQLLAAAIGERRKAKGMSQAEVAKALGRHQPFIANIESGQRRVDLIELIDIASIIDLEILEIIAKIQRFPK